MKNSRFCVVVAVFCVLSFSRGVFAQGSLTPPGAPGATMKTLTQVEPRIPISSLPYSVNGVGSYYLTTNLAGATGITIFSGNVTIDLNGFILQGASSTSSGILIDNTYTNIVIRNGTITGWKGSGIDGYSEGNPRNVRYENLLISSNAQDGIVAEAGSMILNCQFIGNGSTNSSDGGVWCAGGEIVDCTARANSGFGILMNNGTVRNCRCEYNPTGIQIYNGMVVGCAATYNSAYGIYMAGGNDVVRQCHVTGTSSIGIYAESGETTGGVIADCFVNGNSYGIYVSSPGFQVTGNEVTQNNGVGIYLQSSNNRVDGNTLVPNPGGYAVQVSSSYTNNVVVRNFASGGGSFNYVNPGNNDFGPIGTAASATSPWANISHP